MLPFGTGGRRGPVGIGTNRFNPFTLASSVQGHAEFLRRYEPGDAHSVVVVYDVRVFHDLREVYNPDLPNPVAGVSSRDFARIAAEVYAAMGVRVFFPEQGFLSTPELSFAIRRLGATAGLNISASHNHPDDNGGKFYNRHGAQHVPPRDEELADLVDAVREIRRMPFDEALRVGVDRADPRRAAQGLRRPERRPVARAARARRARGVHAAERDRWQHGRRGAGRGRLPRRRRARGGRARRHVPRGAVPRAQPRGARIDGARGARGRGVRRRARDGVRSRRGPDRHLRARGATGAIASSTATRSRRSSSTTSSRSSRRSGGCRGGRW